MVQVSRGGCGGRWLLSSGGENETEELTSWRECRWGQALLFMLDTDGVCYYLQVSMFKLPHHIYKHNPFMHWLIIEGFSVHLQWLHISLHFHFLFVLTGLVVDCAILICYTLWIRSANYFTYFIRLKLNEWMLNVVGTAVTVVLLLRHTITLPWELSKK